MSDKLSTLGLGFDTQAAPEKRKNESIADWLGRQIVSGVYASGDPIPKEMDFLAETGISRGAYREALRRFGLDRVVWLVSPGNPLKARGPAPLEQRMDRARAVMDDPRVTISDAESRLGTRYTADTIAAVDNSRTAKVFARSKDSLNEQIPEDAPGWIVERYEELVSTCTANGPVTVE